jgi:hypothetical protein
VRFTTAAALVNELMEARDEKRLLRYQRHLQRQELLIVDELGFVPLTKAGAEMLFEVFSQRYERGSTLVTSNLPFAEWTEVLGSERLTGALLDRLTHHVHILEMNGDSSETCRLRQVGLLGANGLCRVRLDRQADISTILAQSIKSKSPTMIARRLLFAAQFQRAIGTSGQESTALWSRGRYLVAASEGGRSMYRDLTLWAWIRRRVLTEGASQRQIARETGICRRTVPGPREIATA